MHCSTINDWFTCLGGFGEAAILERAATALLLIIGRIQLAGVVYVIGLAMILQAREHASMRSGACACMHACRCVRFGQGCRQTRAHECAVRRCM